MDAPLAQLDRASVYGTEGYWFESSGVYLPVSRRSKPPSFSELWEAFFVWYQRFTLSSPFCGFLPSVSKRFQVRWGSVEESIVRREYKITDGRIQIGGRRSKQLIADYVLVLCDFSC